MGKCQDHRHNWTIIEDVIGFALSLPKPARKAFLIVASAVIWCIWKQRNDLCFLNSIVHSCRNVVMNIISLALSWTGTQGEDVQTEVNAWLPQDLEEVPLQVAHMEDERLIIWLSEESE